MAQFKVSNSERGMSLENFIHRHVGDLSHKKVKQAIDDKRVSVNGKVVFIWKWNLKPGDIVQFKSSAKDRESGIELSRYQYIKTLYEDDNLLVTDKPAFMDFDSYVEHVAAYLKRIKGKGFYPYVGQIHRLDRETSGILLFTKKKQANTLADQFRERSVKKFYFAVVQGRVEKEQGTIRERLEKGKFEGGKKARTVKGEEGKEAVTEYMVTERYENATVLRVLLGTGRTHQIRVHMASIGHPVIGDKLYGGENTKLINRQALHAWRVEFTHPVTRKKMKFEAPIPADIQKLLETLRASV